MSVFCKGDSCPTARSRKWRCDVRRAGSPPRSGDPTARAITGFKLRLVRRRPAPESRLAQPPGQLLCRRTVGEMVNDDGGLPGMRLPRLKHGGRRGCAPRSVSRDRFGTMALAGQVEEDEFGGFATADVDGGLAGVFEGVASGKGVAIGFERVADRDVGLETADVQ